MVSERGATKRFYCYGITHFMRLVSFCTHCKHYERGFLIFERDQWPEMGKTWSSLESVSFRQNKLLSLQKKKKKSKQIFWDFSNLTPKTIFERCVQNQPCMKKVGVVPFFNIEKLILSGFWNSICNGPGNCLVILFM